MKHLVIGLGEVGKAIFDILSDKYSVSGIDRHNPEVPDGPYDVLHICIPFNDAFFSEVKRYQDTYLADGGLTIIHSTVPLRTTSMIKGAVHSPIRGVHPYLEGGIRTFVKYFGGERADEAAAIFANVGIKVATTKKAENTEAEKLWETQQYRRFILLNKEIYLWCLENDVDFDFVYTKANQDYNDGYIKLGRPDVVRPWLKYMEGPIGGHCVEPNNKLLFPNDRN